MDARDARARARRRGAAGAKSPSRNTDPAWATPRAAVRAAANRVLGGESMLAVRVQPALAWRPGRVHLSTPGGYEFLIPSVSSAVIGRLPRNYELVVHRP